MDFEGSTHVRVGAVPVFGYVQDLGTYPRWFSIVHRAVPVPVLVAEGGPAWSVDIGARVGPFAKTKRVRMVRTFLDIEMRRARFERSERDLSDHSAWTLEATVTAVGSACRLDMKLHYGGFGRVPGLDVLVREEAKRAGGRLERLLVDHGHRRSDTGP